MRRSSFLQAFHSTWLVMILTWSKLASKAIMKCLRNLFATTCPYLYDIMMAQPSVLMLTRQTTCPTKPVASCISTLPHPPYPPIHSSSYFFSLTYTAPHILPLQALRSDYDSEEVAALGDEDKTVCCFDSLLSIVVVLV